MTKSKVKLWDRDRLVKMTDGRTHKWIHPSAIGSVASMREGVYVYSSHGHVLSFSDDITLQELDAEINRSMEAIVEAESQLRQEMTEKVKDSLEKMLADVQGEEETMSGFLSNIDKIGKDVN